MIGFLANENFPLASVELLRTYGFDVASVSLLIPGADDSVVLERAHTEGRIVLTFDRDYGELLYSLGLPAPPGVVYFRFLPRTSQEPAEILLTLIRSKIELTGRFTVVERRQVRQRPLPSIG